MKRFSVHSLDPGWALLSTGMAWGMGYALIESIRLSGREDALVGAWAGLPLYLSLILAGGLLLALFSLPIGLFFALLVSILRADLPSAQIAAVYAGALTALCVFLGLGGTHDLPLAAIIALGFGLLLGRVLLLLFSGAARTHRRFWSRRGLVPLVWALLLLVTIVLALTVGRPSRLFSRSRPADPALRDRPNILLISVDALRADHLGCYGYSQAITPHLDTLARQGILFREAISPSPWTFPTFASLMTSLYPSELGITGEEYTLDHWIPRQVTLDPLRITLAEALQEEGYHTEAIVTNYWLGPEYGFAQGFDHFTRVDRLPYRFARLNDLVLIRLLRVGWPAGYSGLRSLYEAVWGPGGDLWDTPAEVVNDLVLSRLDRGLEEPFFLWVHYIDPHAPYNPPEKYTPTISEVSPERLQYLRSLHHRLYDDSARIRPADNRALIALYDGEVQAVDEAIGRVIARLDELGLHERTVVVILADHGEEFRDHGGLQHGHTLYHELLHVPLIITGPSALLGEPRVLTESVSLLDLMPTLLRLAQAPLPPEVEGEDLLSRRETGSVQRPLYSEGLMLGPERKMILLDRKKLILDPYTGAVELYDLHTDPAEQHNLAANRPALVSALREQVQTWMAHTAEVARRLPRSAGQDAPAGLIRELPEGGY